MGQRRLPTAKTPLRQRQSRQHVSPCSHVHSSEMRQSGTETATGFLKGRGVQCPPAGKRQIMDHSPCVSERPRLEKMVRDVTGTLVDRGVIEPFDRVGDTSVESLLAW